MMKRLDHRRTDDALVSNVERLLVASFPPACASEVFRDSLRRDLESELALMAGGSVEDRRDRVLEENIGRLLTAAAAHSEPGLAASMSVRSALVRQVEAHQRERGWMARWLPRLATAVAAGVAVAGFIVYPLAWSRYQPAVDAVVLQDSARVVQQRPLFFDLTTRTVVSVVHQGGLVSLHAGDAVTTAPGSSAIMSLFDRGTITLSPETALTIVTLLPGVDGKPPFGRLSLDSGRVRSDVTGVVLSVDSPVAAASVRGTEFYVEVVTPDHTRVATDEGVVSVDMEGQSVAVHAGEEVDAILGQVLVVRPQRPPVLVIDSPSRPEVSDSEVVLSGRTGIDAVLTVDGRAVAVDVDGSFRTDLTLLPGANRVVVMATSRAGKSVTVELMLILVD